MPEITCTTKGVDAFAWYEANGKYFYGKDIAAKGEKLTLKASAVHTGTTKYDLDKPIFSCGQSYTVGSEDKIALSFKELEQKTVKISLSPAKGEKSFDLSGPFLNITQAMPDGTMFEQTAAIDSSNTCTVTVILSSMRAVIKRFTGCLSTQRQGL